MSNAVINDAEIVFQNKPLPQLIMTAFGSSNQPYKKINVVLRIPLTVSCV